MTKTRQALFTNCQNFVLPFLQTGLTVLSTPKRNLKVVQWVLNSPKKWSFNSIKQRLISQKIMFNQKWQIYWHFEKSRIKSKSTKEDLNVVFFLTHWDIKKSSEIVSLRQALQLWLFWCKALALFFPTFPFNFGVLLFDAVPIWHLIDKSVSYVMSKRIWPLNSNIFKNQVPGSKYTYLTKSKRASK